MTSKSRLPLYSFFLLLLGCWAWLIWSCAIEWNQNPQYTHGWIVPFLALYFLYKRLSPLQPLPPATSRLLPLFIPIFCLFIFPIELFRQAPIYWRALDWTIYLFAVLVTLQSAWMIGGKKLFSAVFFPCLFVAIALPWPAGIEQKILRELLHSVTLITSDVLNFCGITATQRGSSIILPNAVVVVEEACSGIRSLHASLMVALAMGEIYFLNISKRLALLLMACLIAFVGNLLRAFILASVASHYGIETSLKIHDPLGYGILILVIVSLWILSFLFKKKEVTPSVSTETSINLASFKHLFLQAPLRPYIPALIIALFCFGSAHLWFFSKERSTPRQTIPFFHVQAPETTFSEEMPIPENILQILHPTSGTYLTSQDMLKAPYLFSYHFFWEPSRKNALVFYHRPDVCMPGGGWQRFGEVRQIQFPLNNKELIWYAFPFQRKGERVLLLWGAWCDGQSMQFDFSHDVHLQTELLWQFVKQGKRTFGVEIIGCTVPYTNPKTSIHDAILSIQTLYQYSPAL